MKAQFSVEGEGFSAESEGEKKQKLAEFAAYVKKLKVVPLEELSAHFLLRTNVCVFLLLCSCALNSRSFFFRRLWID